MTEVQGWVLIGLLALFVLVYLYRTSTDVVRKRIKKIFLSEEVAALIIGVLFVLFVFFVVPML